MFEKDVKICYCFLEMSKGISIDLNEIYKMSVKQIEKKFEIYGEKLYLFDGYNNKLRNAIAHFSFVYDNDFKIMKYTDDYHFKKDAKTSLLKWHYTLVCYFLLKGEYGKESIKHLKKKC